LAAADAELFDLDRFFDAVVCVSINMILAIMLFSLFWPGISTQRRDSFIKIDERGFSAPPFATLGSAN
jgi:hypothetical protein